MLKVRNWDRWQSYRRDRGQPPWIKIHRALLRNPEWVQLTDAQRGQLVCLWMLAAERNGIIPFDASTIARICCMSSPIDIKSFISLGFLDAKLTPTRRQVDANMTTQNTDTEKEEDPPLTPLRGNGSIDYPPWLDREAWEEFRAHRREIRQPLTSRSERMAIRQLDKLRQQEPQREIIERTIANRWRGFFPARVNGSIEANGPIAIARRMIEDRERAEQNSGRAVGRARVDWDAAE